MGGRKDLASKRQLSMIEETDDGEDNLSYKHFQNNNTEVTNSDKNLDTEKISNFTASHCHSVSQTQLVTVSMPVVLEEIEANADKSSFVENEQNTANDVSNMHITSIGDRHPNIEDYENANIPIDTMTGVDNFLSEKTYETTCNICVGESSTSVGGRDDLDQNEQNSEENTTESIQEMFQVLIKSIEESVSDNDVKQYKDLQADDLVRDNSLMFLTQERVEGQPPAVNNIISTFKEKFSQPSTKHQPVRQKSRRTLELEKLATARNYQEAAKSELCSEINENKFRNKDFQENGQLLDAGLHVCPTHQDDTIHTAAENISVLIEEAPGNVEGITESSDSEELENTFVSENHSKDADHAEVIAAEISYETQELQQNCQVLRSLDQTLSPTRDAVDIIPNDVTVSSSCRDAELSDSKGEITSNDIIVTFPGSLPGGAEFEEYVSQSCSDLAATSEDLSNELTETKNITHLQLLDSEKHKDQMVNIPPLSFSDTEGPFASEATEVNHETTALPVCGEHSDLIHILISSEDERGTAEELVNENPHFDCVSANLGEVAQESQKVVNFNAKEPQSSDLQLSTPTESVTDSPSPFSSSSIVSSSFLTVPSSGPKITTQLHPYSNITKPPMIRHVSQPNMGTAHSARKTTQDNNSSSNNNNNNYTSNQNKESKYSNKDLNSDLAKLKATAIRLKLATRRPSYLAWLEERTERRRKPPIVGRLFAAESVNGANENAVHSASDSRYKYDSGKVYSYRSAGPETLVARGHRDNDKLTVERKERIEKSLDWLKTELQLMRTQDQALARQLLTLYHDIHKVRLSWSCQEHRELLDEVQYDLEELYEFSNVLDLPRTCLLNTPLKHVGVTRLNISARRFSAC